MIPQCLDGPVSSGRACQAETSASTLSFTVLIRSGLTSVP